MTKVLSLTKGGHKYVFRYVAGCEEDVVDRMVQLAQDDKSDLDWLDAATTSFQLALAAAESCDDLLTGNGNKTS